MIDYVVVGFVYAEPVWSCSQRFVHVLKVGNAVDERSNGPVSVPGFDFIEVNCMMVLEYHSLDKVKHDALLLALYGHSASMAQSKHRVADPAPAGFSDFLKCCKDPKEETRTGFAGASIAQMISMSLSYN